MDFDEYRKRGKEMVDYIADYLENIRDRRVFPNVKPGYMRNLLPDSAPLEGEEWDKIFNDVERVIMPGITHWQSPHMHAYFPALNSFPSLLGDMLADAINCLGFTWASSPACTELETIVMNWLGKMIGLPDEFLNSSNNSKGGGVIQTTASEATLVCLLAGRTQAIKKFHEKTPGYQDSEINARLVAYCSDQAHSSVEKAALIGLVRMRYIESDADLSLRGDVLREAIEDDIKQGLIPFWVCATLGTTGACSFDNLNEVGDVCRDYNIWLHADAAYAGSAFICPEYRIWLKGIEKANSIAFNPSKWLMVHFDCTAMWVQNSTAVHRTFNVEPLYLQHENSGLAIDYMHWQIPLSKRFRALKLWFVLRSFGIKGLQKHIREGVRLAQKFEALVLADYRFEVPASRHLGMVVFRIKGENDLTERLLKRLNHRGNLHCVPASLKGKYVIRFTITSNRTNTDDILSDWAEIRQVTTEILEELNIKLNERAKVSLKDTKEKNEAFGSSLLLSNSPMSPKVVNGSFAAIFDADEFLAKAYAGIRISNQDSPSMRRRVRGILMSGKQFSLDSRMDLVVSSLDSRSTDSNGTSNNSIREDNEDVWEVCESSPGTPPITPPPLISPFQPSSPSTHGWSHGFSPKTRNLPVSEMDGVDQVQNTSNFFKGSQLKNIKKNSFLSAANQINKNNKHMHTFDNTVYVQMAEPLVSVSRCCDAQTLNKCCESSLARNRFWKSCENVTEKFRFETFDRTKIYPGKRYLESIPDYSHAFKSTMRRRHDFKSNMPGITEFFLENELDWDSRNSTFSKDTTRINKKLITIPKLRVRDENGCRIRTTFDCSSFDDSSPESRKSPLSSISWTSLDFEITDDDVSNIDNDDAWEIIPVNHLKCCQKCGHHVQNKHVPL